MNSTAGRRGARTYPEYRYTVGLTARSRWSNDWVLHVNTPSGGINFDEFVYFPNGSYPDRDRGGWYERIGRWAYYHE